MGKRITSRFLIGTFAITFVMWGTIIIANKFGILKFGTPLSMILFIIGGNAPAIVSYMMLKKEHVIDGFGQYVKEAFAIKQKPLHYFIVMIFLALYFGVPYLMNGITKGGEFYTGLLNIPVMILFGGLGAWMEIFFAACIGKEISFYYRWYVNLDNLGNLAFTLVLHIRNKSK